jgi:hypothetical protein
MNISEREKRYLSGVVILLFIFLFYNLVLEPFITREKEIKQAIAAKENLLVKYQNFIGQKNQVAKRLKLLKGALKRLEPQLFSAKTTSLAAAELQNILKTLSTANEIDIKSTKVLDTEVIEKTYEKIPVQLITESYVMHLVNFLYDIETHDKILVIPQLNIDITNYRRPDKVRTTLVIAGFRKR